MHRVLHWSVPLLAVLRTDAESFLKHRLVPSRTPGTTNVAEPKHRPGTHGVVMPSFLQFLSLLPLSSQEGPLPG